MIILYCKHNISTDYYLTFLGNFKLLYVYHHHKSLTKLPTNTNEIPIIYQPSIIGKVFNYFKVQAMYPQYIPNFQKTVSKINPDIICAPEIYDFIFAQAVRYKKKNPDTKLYVWSETRQWPRLWLSRWVMYAFWWYFKRNLRYVEKVFVFSDAGKVFFNTHAPEAEVVVLPAPIETKLFYPEVDKTYMPDGVLRIIMNARYIPLKEHRTFFRTLALLEQSGVKFSASLIGRGGHMEDELKEYATELGIAPYLTWLAPVPTEELRAIYNSHDVLVLASNREAIGMVVPEAMACGLATVTSVAVGANTYVKEGQTGLIFETGNAEALADALQTLADERVVQAFGQAAAQTIREQYSVEVLGEKLLKALE